MNLTNLIQHINKFYPTLVTAFLSDYCYQADEPGANKTYHYGYNSLKWALFRINEINPAEIPDLFYRLLCEHKALEKDEADLQHRILTYPALYNYKQQLAKSKTFDVTKLEHVGFFGSDYFFVINNTNTNLTSKIFRETKADAIIFYNTDTKASGIVLRTNSSIMEEKGLIAHIFHTCQSIERGWTIVGENLIINHGLPNKTPSKISTEQMVLICNEYFVNNRPPFQWVPLGRVNDTPEYVHKVTFEDGKITDIKFEELPQTCIGLTTDKLIDPVNL